MLKSPLLCQAQSKGSAVVGTFLSLVCKERCQMSFSLPWLLAQATVFQRSSWDEQAMPTQLTFPESVLMAVTLHPK